MTAALEGGEWSAARSGRTLPRLRPGTHFTGGWVGRRAGLDGRENLVPTGIRFRTVQPVVSRFTDWTTLPTYIIQSSAKNLIVDPVYIPIRSQGREVGPSSTPVITRTHSDNCPPTLTLCQRPKSNSLNHTITLESEAAIFVSSRSPEIIRIEKSIVIASILSPSSRESAMSSQIATIRLSHEYPGLKSC